MYRILPIVVRSGFGLSLGADISAIFDACDIHSGGTDINAIRTLLRVQRNGRPALEHEARHQLVLLIGPIAEMDPVGFAHRRGFFDPFQKLPVFDFAGNVRYRRFDFRCHVIYLQVQQPIRTSSIITARIISQVILYFDNFTAWPTTSHTAP